MSELVEKLKKVPSFESIPESHLKWLAQNGQCRQLEEGEYLFKKGDPIDNMHVILDGEISLRIEQNGNYQFINSFSSGDITGSLPYSRAKEAVGNGIATKKTMVLSLHKDKFEEMEDVSHELTQALVSVMTSRVREFTESRQQNEKLLALGKLSAGLAHELNNPASALIRTSKELKERLHNFPNKLKDLIAAGLKPHEVDILNNIVQKKSKEANQTSSSMLERSQREEELTDFMEDCGIDEEFSAAEILAEYNFTPSELEELKNKVNDDSFASIISWMENVLQAQKLVEEIRDSARKISELVQSVKKYSHMDRDQEKEATDIPSGIKNTLTMLNHKLKKKNIKVSWENEAGLPKLMAHPGALNQVWTNLIDNAIDAMKENGELKLSFETSKEFLVINISDNGSGISEEIKGKIFDPFFTTKAVGEGTGLGLDIVQKIVVQHQGEVKVSSLPGNTIFSVCLPIK